MSILWSFSSPLQKCQNIIIISTHILCNIHMLTLLYQNFVPLFKKFVVRPQFLVQNKKSVDFNGVLACQEVFCKNRVPFFKKKVVQFFSAKKFGKQPILPNTALKHGKAVSGATLHGCFRSETFLYLPVDFFGVMYYYRNVPHK